MYAILLWPSGVLCKRNKSSSTVSPRMRRAASPVGGGVVSNVFPVTAFVTVVLEGEREKTVGKRAGR